MKGGIGMFFGEFRHQIDEKGRMRIPAKLKEKLGEHPFITRGSNHCLLVLPEAEAVKLFDKKFGGIDVVDPKNNKAVRIMASGGFPAEEDKQGRILLPAHLLRHAQITKNVVTIGAYNRVEIWSEENWDAYSDLDSEAFDECLLNLPANEEHEG